MKVERSVKFFGDKINVQIKYVLNIYIKGKRYLLFVILIDSSNDFLVTESHQYCGRDKVLQNVSTRYTQFLVIAVIVVIVVF